MEEFVIRKATLEDVPSIMDIEEKIFINPWKEQDVQWEIKGNDFSTFLLLESKKEIVGFIVYWITFETATLCQIAIKPEFRRLGLGKRLMDYMHNDCYSKRVDDITLEVRKSNIVAHTLYQKYGYHDVCVKKRYYKNGEDAIYMMKEMIEL